MENGSGMVFSNQELSERLDGETIACFNKEVRSVSGARKLKGIRQ